MFRFETIVGIVIAISSAGVFAAEPDPAVMAAISKKFSGGESYTDLLNKWDKDCEPLAKANKPLTRSCQFLEGKLGTEGVGDEDCNNKKTRTDLEEKAGKAIRDFHSACGSAGYSTSSSDNNIECTESLNKCRICGSKKGAGDNPDMCSTSDSSDDDSSSSSGNDLKINFSKLSRQAEFCPHLGAKAQKDYEKRYDDSRKDVKDMEKKLPEVQKKYTEAMNKGEDEAGQAEDKMVKAQQNLDQELGEAEEKYKQAKKEIAAQIVQLQQQIAQVDDQTRQMVLAKADAETQYNEAIRQIELNCYQSASATVAKLQADRLKSAFNRGSFQNMMKQVGLSDRASWQRIADKYYRYCINSTPTKASKRSAKASYNSALQKADVGLQKLNEQRLGLVQQQINLKSGVCNPNASSGPDFTGQAPEESESCQAAKKALSDSQRAQRKYNSEANKAASDQMKAARKAQNEAGAAQMEAVSLNRQIQDEKTRMKNLRRAAEIADKASDDAPDPKAYDRLNEKFSDLDSIGFKYVQCMNRAKKCESDIKCQKLDKYFKNSGTAATAEKSETSIKLADDKTAPPPGETDKGTGGATK